MGIKITINKVASFKEEAVLKTDKKINLCYGLNGSGKTTFSSYLRDMEGRKFQNCGIEKDIENLEFLVYNQDYVEDTFGETEIKGVFTLGEENKQAHQNIRRSEKEIETARQSITQKTEEKNGVEEQLNNTKDKLKRRIWPEKNNSTRKNLDFCVAGFKSSKEKFFEKVKGTNADLSYSGSFDKLNKESGEIVGENAQLKTKLQPIDNNEKNILTGIENRDIFKENILGSEDNPMAKFISELKNSDWVRSGLDYLKAQEEKCPFCQQNLQERIISDIKNYFDKTYETKIEKLSNLKEKYKECVDTITSSHDDNNREELNNEYNAAWSEIKYIFQRNEHLIDEKIQAPSAVVNLKSSSDSIIALNRIVDETNQIIEEHNNKIGKKKETEKEITAKFWKLLRNQYDNDIVSLEKEEKQLKNKIDKIKKEIEDCRCRIETHKSTVSENQGRITNIETSAEKINSTLKDIGIDDFEIASHDKKYYKIKRTDNDESENQFRSLSEGEKTIISLLYFLERCEGVEDQSETVDKSHRFIIIDDPNTSLSHIFIFNTAQLIYRKVLNEDFGGVFVLTHSLYFFHELAKLSQKEKNNRCFFRFDKLNASSRIKKMNEKDIKNDYQHYWSFIKQYKQEDAEFNPLLANIMRNIMEHYFGFVGIDWKCKLRHESEKYGAFIRYMDRESHSDSTNITDFNELNEDKFYSAFEKAFKTLGHKEHFDKMIQNDTK